jgi:hypothetical protein
LTAYASSWSRERNASDAEHTLVLCTETVICNFNFIAISQQEAAVSVNHLQIQNGYASHFHSRKIEDLKMRSINGQRREIDYDLLKICQVGGLITSWLLLFIGI